MSKKYLEAGDIMLFLNHYPEDHEFTVEELRNLLISEAKFVTPPEVKEGHWIEEPFQSYLPIEHDMVGLPILHTHIGGICSNCGFKTGTHWPEFCEACGAHMSNFKIENEELRK